MIGYLDKAIKPLVLIMLKMSGYAKAFKVEDGDKDKINKLMFFCIDDGKVLEKHKGILSKIKDLKIIELNVLPAYDDRYIKTKIRKHSDKVYANVRSLNMLGYIECESSTFIFVDYLFVYKTNITCKYIYTIVLIILQTNKWRIILRTIFLKIRCYKCCITTELI